MPNQTRFKNKPVMARSDELKVYVREQIQRVVADVKAINDTYHKERERLTLLERARLAAEAEKKAREQADRNNAEEPDESEEPEKVPSYYHGGLAIQMRVVDSDDPLVFPTAIIYWVKGRWSVNTRKGGSTFTKKLHYCGKDKGYTKYNIRAALPKKAKWEIDLTNEVEADLAVYRKYLNALVKFHDALLRCPAVPSIPEGGRVATRLAEQELQEA